MAVTHYIPEPLGDPKVKSPAASGMESTRGADIMSVSGLSRAD